MSAESVGNLEGPGRLQNLFEAFARLDAGQPKDDVRIVQYGDSHTASDLGVAVFRHALQARFGDGGRGFVPLGKPWKFFWEDGIRGTMSADFAPSRVVFHKNGAFTGLDGSYGLLGIGIAASKAGADASTEVSASASHVELAYLRQPHGGSFEVLIDGTRVGKVDTSAPQPGSGFAAFDTTDAPHKFEARTVGDGDVRIFGMALDRAQAGVVVDALGINGAQILTPLRWNEEHFAEQLRHRSPDLVILAYGTNEALEVGLKDPDYERKVVDMLGRIARAVPTASCLLLGPPDLARHAKGSTDWQTWPRVLEISAMQRRIAQAGGCGFYDQIAAMGGPGKHRFLGDGARPASGPRPRPLDAHRLRPARQRFRVGPHPRLRPVARGARAPAEPPPGRAAGTIAHETLDCATYGLDAGSRRSSFSM